MRLALPTALALLLLPLGARAEEDPRFTQLRSGAEAVGGLGSFLEKYVGECEPGAGKACEDKAKAFRKEHDGKRHYLLVGEDSAGMLQPGRFDEGSGELEVNVTPFFPASNYALCQGSPKRTDAKGNPVLGLVRAEGQAPDGWMAGTFQRLFQMRGVRAQVVFVPTGVWSLPKKGGGRIYGVSARIEGIQVQVARTGEPLALWLARGH
ncbi:MULTISPECIES: DUF6066 family protein [Myxococcaceae]|uniref:DUF6066 family protein n=1 Tax=Myxococcaceae TaxID=31 RepID=UPI00129C8053|nr:MULTISPECIES: DUF6066 family protein [Myxococcaceae]MBF5044164.1 hypothetical protein [Simulacricoccus sp. 17bor-14]